MLLEKVCVVTRAVRVLQAVVRGRAGSEARASFPADAPLDVDAQVGLVISCCMSEIAQSTALRCLKPVAYTTVIAAGHMPAGPGHGSQHPGALLLFAVCVVAVLIIRRCLLENDWNCRTVGSAGSHVVGVAALALNNDTMVWNGTGLGCESETAEVQTLLVR